MTMIFSVFFLLLFFLPLLKVNNVMLILLALEFLSLMTIYFFFFKQVKIFYLLMLLIMLSLESLYLILFFVFLARFFFKDYVYFLFN